MLLLWLICLLLLRRLWLKVLLLLLLLWLRLRVRLMVNDWLLLRSFHLLRC